MVRAQLRGLYSIDLPDGPPMLPDDPSNWWGVVQADIGPADGDGADTFTFYVCTLARLSELLTRDGRQWGRYLLLVRAFDWRVVEDAVRDLLSRIEGDTWEDVASQIAGFAQWEFGSD